MDPILENENQNPSDLPSTSKTEKARHKHKKKQITGQPGSETVVGRRHKFLVTTLSTAEDKQEQVTPSKTHNNAHTIHFGTRGAESQRPHVRNIFNEKPTASEAPVHGSARPASAERDVASKEYVHATIHGTSSPRSSIFDIFRPRRKSDSKKHSSLMQNVKAALGKPSTSGTQPKSLEVPEIRKNGEKVDEATASDKTYYHTVTGASSRKTSTITRVMDIFRSKPQAEASTTADSGNKKKLQKQTRRSSVGTTSPTYHKSSYAALDPTQAKQVFREVRGLPRYDPYLSIVQISLGGRDKTRLLLNFFKYHKCYEILPKSAKVIIFDTKFLVRKTFPTLISNGIRSAPLWDSAALQLVGMITVTDFIRILLLLFVDKNSMHDLELHTLHSWKKLLRSTARPLFSIGPDQSLHEAINILIEQRIHRLPMIDPFSGDVLYILSHKRILRFLFVYLNEFPELTFFHSKLIDLRIGTYNNIKTITDETTVKEAFDVLLEHNISALPVVDNEGKLLDIYAKCEVLNLVSEKLYLNLLITIREVRQKNKDWQEKMQKCHSSVTLYEALEIIVRTESHRLLLVDKDDKLVGVVSLSDMLVYLNRTIPSESKGTALQELFKPLEENMFVESAKECEPDTQSEDNADISSSKDAASPPPAALSDDEEWSTEPTLKLAVEEDVDEAHEEVKSAEMPAVVEAGTEDVTAGAVADEADSGESLPIPLSGKCASTAEIDSKDIVIGETSESLTTA